MATPKKKPVAVSPGVATTDQVNKLVKEASDKLQAEIKTLDKKFSNIANEIRAEIPDTSDLINEDSLRQLLAGDDHVQTGLDVGVSTLIKDGGDVADAVIEMIHKCRNVPRKKARNLLLQGSIEGGDLTETVCSVVESAIQDNETDLYKAVVEAVTEGKVEAIVESDAFKDAIAEHVNELASDGSLNDAIDERIDAKLEDALDGYVSSDDLNDFVTEGQLSDLVTERQLENALADYVNGDQLDERIGSLVTKEELSEAVGKFLAKEDLTSDLSVLRTDLTAKVDYYRDQHNKDLTDLRTSLQGKIAQNKDHVPDCVIHDFQTLFNRTRDLELDGAAQARKLSDLDSKVQTTVSNIAMSELAKADVLKRLASLESEMRRVQALAVRAVAQEVAPKAVESTSDLRSDVKDAGYRIAAKQITKTVHAPLVAAFCTASPEHASMIELFFRSDLGKAAMGASLSIGATLVGDRLADSHAEVADRLSRELRVGAMAEAADFASDLLLGPLRASICAALSNPGIEKVRVVTEAVETEEAELAFTHQMAQALR